MRQLFAISATESERPGRRNDVFFRERHDGHVMVAGQVKLLDRRPVLSVSSSSSQIGSTPVAFPLVFGRLQAELAEVWARAVEVVDFGVHSTELGQSSSGVGQD